MDCVLPSGACGALQIVGPGTVVERVVHLERSDQNATLECLAERGVRLLADHHEDR